VWRRCEVALGEVVVALHALRPPLAAKKPRVEDVSIVVPIRSASSSDPLKGLVTEGPAVVAWSTPATVCRSPREQIELDRAIVAPRGSNA
jgi:hypothetical protein